MMSPSEVKSPNEQNSSRGYLASLPERLFLSALTTTGGLLFETSRLVLPKTIRQTKIYQATIERLFRIVIEFFGGVEGVFEADEVEGKSLLYRKTTGNVAELAGLVSLGYSPIWILAVTSDVLGGGRVVLHELVGELKRDGVVDVNKDFDSTEELLRYLEKNSGNLADLIDLPPLTIQDMRATFNKIKSGALDIPTKKEVDQSYRTLVQVSTQEKKTLLQVSALIAGGLKRVGLNLGQKYFVQSYVDTFSEISRIGWWTYLHRTFRPYLQAIGKQFSPQKESLTQKIFFRRR